jgi:hypothetical protein
VSPTGTADLSELEIASKCSNQNFGYFSFYFPNQIFGGPSKQFFAFIIHNLAAILKLIINV